MEVLPQSDEKLNGFQRFKATIVENLIWTQKYFNQKYKRRKLREKIFLVLLNSFPLIYRRVLHVEESVKIKLFDSTKKNKFQ